MLEDIKELLEFQGVKPPSDKVLNIYIRRAIASIKNYLNTDKFSDNEIVLLYSDVVVSLLDNSITAIGKGTKGVESKSQGGRKITYSKSDDSGEFTISNDMKAMLPTPFIKMR